MNGDTITKLLLLVHYLSAINVDVIDTVILYHKKFKAVSIHICLQFS